MDSFHPMVKHVCLLMEIKDLDHHQHQLNCTLAEVPTILKGLKTSCWQSEKQTTKQGQHGLLATVKSAHSKGVNLKLVLKRAGAKKRTHTKPRSPCPVYL